MAMCRQGGRPPRELADRDRELAMPKPAKTVRILGIGDSVTFGYGVSLEGSGSSSSCSPSKFSSIGWRPRSEMPGGGSSLRLAVRGGASPVRLYLYVVVAEVVTLRRRGRTRWPCLTVCAPTRITRA